MLALCAQILICLSVSGEKAPKLPFLGPITKMAKLGRVWATDTLTQIKS